MAENRAPPDLSPPAGSPRPAKLTLQRYRLPLRRVFEHAALRRDTSEGLLVQLELSDGTVGLGEGVPRPYVTGETVQSAIEVIREVYAARLASENPLAGEPAQGSAYGVMHNAAWCACELAYLDGLARSAEAHLADYLGKLLQRPVARKIAVRAAGVVGAESPREIRRGLRRMRWFGLRDFKVKVGLPGDRENLLVCNDQLRRGLPVGRITLRADANGAWSFEEALAACQWLRVYRVAALEQPLPKGDEADLPPLREKAGLPLMLDESVADYAGAERLARAGAADYWNLRVSKNGGLLATLRLAQLAESQGVGLMLGCMVGESGILSAAARAFLLLVPRVRFVENSYGEFLLAEDLVSERTRFGYGGRLRPLYGPGLGVTLDSAAVERLAERVAEIKLT